MENYIIKIETYGMKCLKEKVCINFNNETVKLIKPLNKSIKSIFGLNGAGKSALINSINLYKKLLFKSNVLVNDSDIDLLRKLINKEINEFFFKIYFLNVNDDIKTIYSHEILIDLEDDEFNIKHETLCIISGQTISSGTTKTIYSVENGVLRCSSSAINNLIKEKSLNLLNKRSLISMFFTRQFNDALLSILGKIQDKENIDTNSILQHVMATINFSNKIIISLEGDDNFDIMGNLNLSSQDDNRKYITPLKVSTFEDKIEKNMFDNYQKQLDKQTKFIQIFKPTLKQIVPVLKEDNEFYRIRKEFDYGSYRIDAEYESAGIKKLMSIFSYIEAALGGDIVFIDDMDTNINGMFLDRLLEYFIEEGKGTLCFTSHNYDSMNVLKKYKGSLLFLGETGKLITLPKNGNSNPINYYKQGMVEDSPFNFESYDFERIFSKKE